ncbi:MAG: serine/threonine protein kinase [Myxococcales bacterium FL481]|nr:MAG: serine/threonine protein kinase [Myxococcales bacterium FL481]
MPSADPLQRYQVMEPLASGSQGRTFVAIDRQTNERVAVKVFDLGGSNDWRSFERFEREIDTLKSLDHPGIPRYIDNYASEATGEYFLVMSLVPGRPLSEWIGGSRQLSDDELESVLMQTLRALAYLHDRSPPIVHRDVKPANLVMQDDGRVTLVDFGGVRRALDADAAPTVVGTFGYMAPEQAQGQATPGADVYSLGVTIAALAANLEANELPRDGLAYRLPHGKLSAPWRAVVSRMLEPDPRQRFPNAAAALAAIEQTRERKPVRAETRGSLQSRGDEDLAFDDSVRDLARAPRPVVLVVWVLASIAAGATLVFEAALLPLFYQLAVALSDEKDKARVAAQRREVTAKVKRTRRWLTSLSSTADKARDHR